MKDNTSFTQMEAFIRSALAMKAKMIKQGLTEKVLPCGKCHGKLHISLRGRKQHAWVRCDGKGPGACQRSMME